MTIWYKLHHGTRTESDIWKKKLKHFKNFNISQKSSQNTISR